MATLQPPAWHTADGISQFAHKRRERKSTAVPPQVEVAAPLSSHSWACGLLPDVDDLDQLLGCVDFANGPRGPRARRFIDWHREHVFTP